MSEESAEPAVERVQEVEVSEEAQREEQEQVAKENVEQPVIEQMPEQVDPLNVEVAIESEEQTVEVPLVVAQNVPPQEETIEVDQSEPRELEQVAEIEAKAEEQFAQVEEMVVEQSEVPENLQFEIQTKVPEVETDVQVEIENEVPEVEANAQLKGQDDNVETEIQVDEPQQQEEENKEQEEESERSPSSEESEEADDKEEKGEEQDTALEESQDAMQLPAAAAFETALEDEEMPSMVTISSVSRIDESETNIKQDEEKKVDVEGSSPERKAATSKPPAQEDSDSECVVIESDDDEDVHDRRNRRPADDDDDEDDDDDSRDYSDDYDEGSSSGEYDSEAEMERERYGRRYSRHPHRRHRDEEDDEDEDEEEYPEDDEDEERDKHMYPHDEDEDSDSKPDHFDATSDDLVLRHSNGLVKEHKERSASFTDLSLIRDSKQKHSVNPYSHKAREERNHHDGRKHGYGHVESKVKKYIMGIKEQSRISTERKKSQEEAKYKNQEGTEVYRSEEVVNSCRAMKDYAEKALKEVAEYTEKEELFFQKGFENGEVSIFPKNADAVGEMEVDPIAVEPHKEQDKMNGAIQNEDEPYVPERKGILRRENASSKPVLNGDGSSICNLRTLSYDEYMKPPSKDNTEEVSADQAASKQYNDNNEPMQILRIESVMSNYLNSEKVDDSYYDRKTPPLDNQSENQEQQGYYTENAEIDYLRTELDQKHAQFEHLRDAYQKAMAEKMAMQIEMQNLKQALSFYQHQEQQKKLQQKKETAIQTEPAVVTPRDMPILDIDGVTSHLDARLLGAESLASSQWSESTGSAAISMDPPNVTTALNSDESAGQQSKASKKNAFSRAFMTSQRILQSLANITHGKKKTYTEKSPKPLPKSAAKPLHRSALSKSEETQADGRSASKKRKATDTLEMSSSAQPFKIPHIDGQQPDDPEKCKGANENKDGEASDDEEMHEEDEVKMFIYPEDEDAREHSFLIQAKEVTDNPRPGIRECGPYLLGNIEVYMTEMNGTINIWGKELSQESTSQNIEELEASVRSKDLKAGFRWQSTPRIFSQQASSSTSKKSRVQPRFTQHQKSLHSCDVSNAAADCASCSPCHHRVAYPPCNHSAHENQHSCCIPTIRIDDSHCGCNTAKTCCNAQKFVDVRRVSMPNVHQYQCCSSNVHRHCSPRSLPPEEVHKHQPFVRRHSFNHSDEEEEEQEEDEELDDVDENGENSTLKLNHSQQRESSPHSCSSKLVPPPGSRKRRRSSGGQSDSSTNQNESDPLLSQKIAADAVDQSNKRKLGKRRVGGLLLDLLKGCGDCKSPMNRSNLQNNASIYEPSTSLHPKVSCSPNRQSCSLRSTDKCSQCRVKRDKTDEIQAQLEFFSQEMNKLRSRSDTLRNMLDNLRDTAEC